MYRLYTLFIFRVESHMCLAWVGEVAGRLISQAYPVLVIIPKIKSQSTSREVVSEWIKLGSRNLNPDLNRPDPDHDPNLLDIPHASWATKMQDPGPRAILFLMPFECPINALFFGSVL